MTISMKSKEKGGDASEDEQVAEDEELGAAVEEGPQAPPGWGHRRSFSCGGFLDHSPHLAVVVVDHPGVEGDVVQQVVDCNHNLHFTIAVYFR